MVAHTALRRDRQPLWTTMAVEPCSLVASSARSNRACHVKLAAAQPHPPIHPPTQIKHEGTHDMSDGRIKDIDRQVLAIFMEEVVEFFEYLRAETSLPRVRAQIDVLRTSSHLAGARVIAEKAAATLAAIAKAKYIDLYVVAAVCDFTEEVAWQAREAGSLADIEFTGEAVKLKLGVAQKSWWRMW